MSERFPPITPARLDWQANVPVAPAFGDPYFSRDAGPAETQHVFLQGNRLSARFRALPARGRFVIGETGFGTGLNFLCAAQAFLEDAPADAMLHFLSVEKHPLDHEDLRRALQHWPASGALAAELAAHYPPLTPGFHRLSLSGGRILLTLIFADAVTALSETHARVDAWFLDGFAPARNPDMWCPPLFQQLARLSAPGASVATFTAAGFVRRGLIAAGFAMQRVPGFGRKREMLTGHFVSPGGCSDSAETPHSPPHSQPPPQPPWQPQAARPGQAAIVGAGLAGATCARALAERGWQVTVFDPAGIASGASGNLAGVVYTTPSAHATAQNRFYQSSYLHTLHWLNRHGFPAHSDQGALTGVAQYPAEARHRDKQQAALHSGHWPASLLQPTSDGRGINLLRGGYISPPQWCAHLLDHPLIRLQQHAVSALTSVDGGGWIVRHDAGTSCRADIVVLANASAARDLVGLHWLPLKLIRGQVSYCQATEASRQWQQAICHSVYLTPAIQGLHCVGATFDLRRHDLAVDPDDDQRNLTELQQQLPAYWHALGGEEIHINGQRVGLRCQSTDFLPLAGPVPDATGNPHRVHQDLYMSVAHGSRGITGSTLCAELIAALVNDEPRPVDEELVRALAPERFILRQRKKQPEWTP